MKFTYIDSPIGQLMAAGDRQGLSGLYFPWAKRPTRPGAGWERSDALFARVRTQLDEYFAGERQAFDIPLNATGNGFQKRVWNALYEIPYGTTTSYGKLADGIEQPGGGRAVGVANSQNPISILVPCHRVIGANGSLTGYAGGLEVKRFLLDHEARHAGSVMPLFSEPVPVAD